MHSQYLPLHTNKYTLTFVCEYMVMCEKHTCMCAYTHTHLFALLFGAIDNAEIISIYAIETYPLFWVWSICLFQNWIFQLLAWVPSCLGLIYLLAICKVRLESLSLPNSIDRQDHVLLPVWLCVLCSFFALTKSIFCNSKAFLSGNYKPFITKRKEKKKNFKVIALVNSFARVCFLFTLSVGRVVIAAAATTSAFTKHLSPFTYTHSKRFSQVWKNN